VIVKEGDKTNKSADGTGLAREVVDEVLEGGELIRGTIRLAPAGSRKSKSGEGESADLDGSSEEGQSPILDAPSSEDKTEAGTVSIPPAWANVWTTNDRVELWV